jgi:hypothetical protein
VAERDDYGFGDGADETYEGVDYGDGGPATGERQARRGIDFFTLLVGIVTLVLSAYVLSDGASWVPRFDLRWALAGSAVLVGVLMLGASFRKDRS